MRKFELKIYGYHFVNVDSLEELELLGSDVANNVLTCNELKALAGDIN